MVQPTQRQLFLSHVAQTSNAPLMLNMVRAEGAYIYDTDGKQHLDLISGISVSNIGHCHPKVVEAVQQQAASFMYLMVNGEFIHSPQVQFASAIAEAMPAPLDNVYFVNSGAEATDGAMKLAKRYTGRSEIVYFDKSYHGSTHAALSIMGDEYFKNAYRPLLPDTRALDYGVIDQLDQITERTACIFMETVQGEAGVVAPSKDYIQALRARCTEVGALLILDEIQVGFGRTGTMFAFEQYGIVPDVVLLAKALGGGMPIGAFVASSEMMGVFKDQPVLGHINTFGGHPVCCAAGLAGMQVLLEGSYIQDVKAKEALFHELLVHPSIIELRSKGLLMALELESFEFNKKVIDTCIEMGVITDWFLFSSNCLRIAPPLIITEEQIRFACKVILQALDEHTA